MRKHLFNLLKIVVSVGLIVFIFYLVDIHTVLEKISQVHWPYLVGAALLMIAGTALRSVRWEVLLQPLDIHVPLIHLTYLMSL